MRIADELTWRNNDAEGKILYVPSFYQGLPSGLTGQAGVLSMYEQIKEHCSELGFAVTDDRAAAAESRPRRRASAHR